MAVGTLDRPVAARLDGHFAAYQPFPAGGDYMPGAAYSGVAFDTLGTIADLANGGFVVPMRGIYRLSAAIQCKLSVLSTPWEFGVDLANLAFDPFASGPTVTLIDFPINDPYGAWVEAMLQCDAGDEIFLYHTTNSDDLAHAETFEIEYLGPA